MESVPLTKLRSAISAFTDVVRRVWNQSAEDNVFFLAGGLAFNVLLALVPFALLLISGLAVVLNSQPEQAVRTVTGLIPAFLPNDATAATELLESVVSEVYRTRGAVGFYAAISFAWFSTRLFGSLRSVLALVFDKDDHGIVSGKLFDLVATMVATFAVAVYIAVTAYLNLAAAEGAQLMVRAGLRESAMSSIAYMSGRLLAIAVIFLLFYALYRGLPRHRPSVRTAFIAALTTSVFFEIARHAFSFLVRHFDPSSLYTGTIAAIVAVVFWTYYGSLLFLLGGIVAQATELRRHAGRAELNEVLANASLAGTIGQRNKFRSGANSTKSGTTGKGAK